MVALSALWLPILLSAVFVFVVSSVIHMMMPMHKADCKKMPNEDKVLDALRANGVPPGEYMFPMPASMKDCSSPEMKAKFERGPVGSILIRPTKGMNMGKSLLQWFVYSLVVSTFAAYVADPYPERRPPPVPPRVPDRGRRRDGDLRVLERHQLDLEGRELGHHAQVRRRRDPLRPRDRRHFRMVVA